MKVKDFLDWFSDMDPESELKVELFEQIYCNELVWSAQEYYREYYTELDFRNIKNDDGTCEIIFELGGVKE